jgi:DNA-binding response OmpR family regulator
MPASSKKIWVIDDDPGVRLVFRQALTEKGYRVAEFEDGRIALARLASESPALFILDVDMPHLDGWQTLEALRRRGYTQPVLMVTHANEVSARVRGLEEGADDYVGKPCEASELCARVRALLRRTKTMTPKSASSIRTGDIEIDLTNKTASKAGTAVRLTRTDYAVLTLLHSNLGRPVAREVILKQVWGGLSGSSHALDTHLWRLRRKLGGSKGEIAWIKNVSGIGYSMDFSR